MMRKLIAAVALTAVLLMSGCASVPMASKDSDAKAKQFAPSQGNTANLYIYRNEILGSAIKMTVLIDGVSVGDTVAKSYIFKTLPAGDHTITSKAENDNTLPITMQAGQVYFVWQEVKMGALYARSKLHLVDEATGEAAVKECDLIKGDDFQMAQSATPATPADPAVPPAPPAPPVAPPPPAAAAAPVADPPAAPVSPVPPSAAADPTPPPSPAASTPTPDAGASADVQLAQSVASQLGCGAAQSNGGSTYVAPCGNYSVLIDCYAGQCHAMHTINVKKDE
jgi:Protein of unknown function (DUF2846)